MFCFFLHFCERFCSLLRCKYFTSNHGELKGKNLNFESVTHYLLMAVITMLIRVITLTHLDLQAMSGTANVITSECFPRDELISKKRPDTVSSHSNSVLRVAIQQLQ